MLSLAHLPGLANILWDFPGLAFSLPTAEKWPLSCHPCAQPPCAPAQQPVQKPPAKPVSDFLPFTSQQGCPVPKGAAAECGGHSMVNWPQWCHYSWKGGRGGIRQWDSALLYQS